MNIYESNRSSTPPWPGISVPLSLMPASRFMTLSIRSPSTDATEMTAPRPTVLGIDSGQEVTSLKASAQATEAHKPPSAPSTVFLGESGVRGVRPKDLPAQHALCCFTVKHHTRSHGVYGHVSMKRTTLWQTFTCECAATSCQRR